MKLKFDLEDLRVLVAVSEMKAMRRVAVALGLEQSAVSRRIRDLERKLDLKLFVRTNAGTHPTTAGLELMGAARRIVMEAQALDRRLKSRERRRHPHLSIGVQVSPSVGLMSGARRSV